MKSRIIALISLWSLMATPTLAQETHPEIDDRLVLGQSEYVPLIERDLSGPRIGFTWVVGGGELADRLDANEVGRFISQFGWHFEHNIVPRGGGAAFVIETIPLVAGVEYGRAVPSITLAMGLRFQNGFEFGLGPNVMLTGYEDTDDIRSALVMAVGRTFDYGGVSVPLNLAVAQSPDGVRVSFVFGYAMRQSSKKHFAP